MDGEIDRLKLTFTLQLVRANKKRVILMKGNIEIVSERDRESCVCKYVCGQGETSNLNSWVTQWHMCLSFIRYDRPFGHCH